MRRLHEKSNGVIRRIKHISSCIIHRNFIYVRAFDTGLIDGIANGRIQSYHLLHRFRRKFYGWRGCMKFCLFVTKCEFLERFDDVL